MITEIRSYHRLYLKWRSEYGWGVFTEDSIKSGETVERCYCLLDNFETSPLKDYVFRVRAKSADVYHVLGFGSIYNHSETPNLAVKMVDEEQNIIEFCAVRDIEKDEELRIKYDDGYWENKNKKPLI